MRILLKQIMDAKGLNYDQVEALTGVSRSTILDIANEKESPYIDDLEKLAAGLGVKMQDIAESDFW